MKAFYYTFGCKVNQYETENIREMLGLKGYEDTDDFCDAQICIVNTCTVTSQSDSKCRQLIHKIKKENPDCVLVLAGCFVQSFQTEAEKLSECDIIVGTGNKTQIPALIDEYLYKGERIVKVVPHEKGEKFEPMTNGGTDKTRAYIKIQDGCDQYCTYCIIPYARGHVCSKPLNQISEEVKKLVQTGHKEIILTGINLCCYGKDFSDGTRLVDAIEETCKVDGDFRVRLGSIEPEMISDDDIKRMSALEKLCPHFHLSLQSGCDNTLKAMNRHYNSDEYFTLCEKIRANFSNCAITTDIMVGFAGETEEDFKASCEFVKKVSFADAHIFPYSRRSGTVADKMNGQLDKKTKQKRAQLMTDICTDSRNSYFEKSVGRVCDVLFEKESSPDWYQGHTDDYVLVKIRRDSPNKTLRRCIRKIRITDFDTKCCYGEFV